MMIKKSIIFSSSITSVVLSFLTAATVLAVCHGFTAIPPLAFPAVSSWMTTPRTIATATTTKLQLSATGVVPATASTVIEEPETITKEDQETSTIEIIQDSDVDDEKDHSRDGWEIRLWNDPFNKREFVARCLSTICGKSDTESYQIMMQAHKNGMGVIGRYHFEIAEQYHGSLKENGLTVDMIQVDDE